jgi:eukaryotic-like serine/threonine-protein kinase
MGVVWAGSDRERGRKFAVKLLRSGGNAQARAQLLERARAVIPLRHPNLLPVYEVGSDGSRDFIAMELIEGECVADWLARQPSPKEITEAMVAAGKALAAAHRAGLLHRGFKLHNVLRAKDGTVRVSDFGLARGQLEGTAPKVLSAVAVAAGKDLGDDQPMPRNQHAVLDASLTQGGVYVGTPGYMAPELLRGSAADRKSDQFAFCVAMWEALAGKRPFSGDTLEALEQAVRAGVKDGEGANLSPGLRAALVRGMDPEPSKRWPDLDTLLLAIERGASPRSRTGMMAAAGVVAVGSLVTIFFLVRGSGGPEPVALPVDDEPAAAAASASASACSSAQAALDEVWSEARRARLLAQLSEAGGATGGTTIEQLDEIGQRWLSAYKEACSIADEAAAQRRLACLMVARERADAAIDRLEGAGVDPGGPVVTELLPDIEACSK